MCTQSFHPECLGLSDDDITEILNKPHFICPDCLQNEQVLIERNEDISVSQRNIYDCGVFVCLVGVDILLPKLKICTTRAYVRKSAKAK